MKAAGNPGKAQGLQELLGTIGSQMQSLELARRDVYDVYECYCEADADDTETANDCIDTLYAYVRQLENVNRLQAMAIGNLIAG
jgi:hypothetical protein